MGDRTLNLSAFSIRQCCKTLFNAVVIGKKNTGKSTLIQDILFYLSRTGIPRACVFSGTEESNGFYKQFIPGTFIFDDQDVENSLKAIVANQKKLTMQKRLGEVDKNLDTRIVIVLDDIGYKKDILKSEIIRQIFMNGRHHNIILIVACQYCMDLTPDLRTNADYVYILKQNAGSAKKSLYDNFFGAFEKPKDFRTVLDACTQNYQCLVLDNTIPTTHIPDICFWYKARFGRRFRLGCPELWAFHNRWFVSETERYLQQEKLVNAEKLSSRKNSNSRKRLESSNLLVRKRR